MGPYLAIALCKGLADNYTWSPMKAEVGAAALFEGTCLRQVHLVPAAADSIALVKIPAFGKPVTSVHNIP